MKPRPIAAHDESTLRWNTLTCGLPFALLVLALFLLALVMAGCGEDYDWYVGKWVNEERNFHFEIVKTDSGLVLRDFAGMKEDLTEQGGKLIWGNRTQVFEKSGDMIAWTVREPDKSMIYLERTSSIDAE